MLFTDGRVNYNEWKGLNNLFFFAANNQTKGGNSKYSILIMDLIILTKWKITNKGCLKFSRALVIRVRILKEPGKEFFWQGLPVHQNYKV